MLIVDIYSLMPAFTLAGFLIILLWPENIAYKTRLRLFMAILFVWVLMSIFGMLGYGTTERSLICLINAVVGCFGLIALFFAHQIKPSRK